MIAPSEAIALQKRLRRRVSHRWEGRPVRLIGAADVHFPSPGRSRAALVTLTFPELDTVERVAVDSPTVFPYIPGLLSFREIPPILEAWKRLERPPDLLLCDGHGIAHPRGLGFASHLGLVLDIPTIGCAKSHLYGSFDEPGMERGARAPVRGAGGGTIGTVLRTRAGVRPVFVSIGHRIDLRTAVRLVLACSPRFRIPVPLRLAHRAAGGS
jgi:deoxyribonuclease V